MIKWGTKKEDVMVLKFVHIADMHFDSPFTGLNSNGDLGNVRRLEQRKIFKKMMDYIKKNQIEYVLIAGDLYEHPYVRKSTIEYINQLFQQMKDTMIFISPGNHDPFVKGSYYDTFEWSENVKICKSELEVFQTPEVDIYMTAFTDFYKENSNLEQVKVKAPEKINILLTLCDLNGSKDKDGFSYHPILESKLEALKFDYIAMGHIHRTNFMPDKKIVYPGSMMSFGFDELGKHGMIVGELTKYELKTEFVQLDDRIFEKYEFSVDDILSKEELIEKLNDIFLEENKMYEIVLVGNRKFAIDTREILRLVNSEAILKIKDKTQASYDIEKIAKENNLRGIFVREVIKKFEEGIYSEEQVKRTIELGLEVM